MSTPHRCGTVALIGRPNVGKSTLINALTGYKVSIVTPKPQTTRHRILGVCTRPEGQLVLVDTPGIHRSHRGALNRAMNRTARAALAEVDVVALVVDGQRWTDEDAELAADIARMERPRVLVVNKVDRVPDKSNLFPYLEKAQAQFSADAVVPISATKGSGLESLVAALIALLPEGEAQYEADDITDRSERFLAAEQVREQVLLQLGEEVPYACNVEIESFAREGALLRIQAVIWVEREGQKAIVIGRSGERLKRIGSRARESLEGLFEQKVFLGLWVKHRENWSDDERALRQFGLSD